MPLIVNGTTIPTTSGSLKYNGVDVQKVDVVKNGVRTTVWEVPQITYIIQNGVDKGLTSFNHDGSAQQWGAVGEGFYGAKLYAGDEDEVELLYTFSKPSGLNKLNIEYGSNSWAHDTITIRLDNGTRTEVLHTEQHSGTGTSTFQVDVSAYPNFFIEISSGSEQSSGSEVVGIKNIYFSV